MSTTPGIDVSRWQGEINWEMVAAAGYRFAVIRATIGNYYTDPRFYENWNGARGAGLLVSAYHVATPEHSAGSQIDRLFDVLGERKADLPLVLDVELSREISPTGITACVRDCVQKVERQDDRKPIIYTAGWFWNHQVLESPGWSEHDLWVAHYGVSAPTLPTGWDEWQFWQHSDKGRVPGIAAETDLNQFNGSYDDLLAYANTEPEPRPEPQPSAGLRARVTASRLNVRSGPGVNYSDVGDLHAGDVVGVVSLDGEDVWVEFEPGKWAALVFHGTRYMELE
ncbi:MAG: GH25 family lysozyme [Chloroflexota bacterium]|nr:GH25 family lysozyme [Chloroflexota bacterium]